MAVTADQDVNVTVGTGSSDPASGDVLNLSDYELTISSPDPNGDDGSSWNAGTVLTVRSASVYPGKKLSTSGWTYTFTVSSDQSIQVGTTPDE